MTLEDEVRIRDSRNRSFNEIDTDELIELMTEYRSRIPNNHRNGTTVIHSHVDPDWDQLF
jgi:hypothetical protein